MATDRFGNPHTPTLPYARGRILTTTEDDFRKLQRAWSIIRERRPENVFIFTGLEHSLPMTGDELRFADDEIAPALYFERLRSLALTHLGGSSDLHDMCQSHTTLAGVGNEQYSSFDISSTNVSGDDNQDRKSTRLNSSH